MHRHEPSGTLHGLLRVRHITQDDAHIFCTEEQIPEEVQRCLDFGFAIYDMFGFEPRLELSTRPEKRVGSDEMWDRAEAALERALVDKGLEYELNEGDGAFYGPKIDLHMTDSIGRSWQLGTVQLDYYMPERFELAYTGADNAEHRPVMIHRALMGSLRALHRHPDRALRGRVPALAGAGAGGRAADRRPPRRLRGTGGARAARRGPAGRGRRRAPSRSGSKIREAEVRKVPYMLVVGDREAESGEVAVRRHGEGDLGSRRSASSRRARWRRCGASGDCDEPRDRASPLYSRQMKGTHTTRRCR